MCLQKNRLPRKNRKGSKIKKKLVFSKLSRLVTIRFGRSFMRKGFFVRNFSRNMKQFEFFPNFLPSFLFSRKFKCVDLISQVYETCTPNICPIEPLKSISIASFRSEDESALCDLIENNFRICNIKKKFIWTNSTQI
eukprot:Sdes_comp18378_c0_seq1m8181